MHRPKPPRKGGEEDRTKGLDRREPAGENRTIGSASERPLGESNNKGISRTASECHRVGLRVSDKTGEAKRSIVLERRRWL